MISPGEVVNDFLFTRPVTLLWRNFVGPLKFHPMWMRLDWLML